MAKDIKLTKSDKRDHVLSIANGIGSSKMYWDSYKGKDGLSCINTLTRSEASNLLKENGREDALDELNDFIDECRSMQVRIKELLNDEVDNYQKQCK